MEMPSQKIERLLRMRRAGWANVSRPGLIGRVLVPAGTGSLLVERGTGCMVVSADDTPITRTEKVQFPRAIRFDRNRFRKHVSDFENNISYMYLDSKGKVTVGLGHLLRDAEEAKRLPFFERGTTNRADPAHIENAYLKVLSSGLTGSKHTVFKELTHIDLDLGAIETLFDDDVNQFLPLLTNKFPDYETYPASVQLGMLDLAYNMGTEGFFSGFPVFREALKFRNWIKVAEQSHREEVNEEGKVNEGMQNRNKVVRGWFLEAIKDEPFFLNPDCPPKRLSMIAG
ncbi:MAG: hypothetical protein ACE5H8_02145 [Alphaproteobacteria bacterium]